MSGTPAAEFEITPAVVRSLLEEQHPDLAHLELQAMGEGWDNAIFRLGDALAVRLPRRAAMAHLICHEQTWLPHLATHLPLPVPVPYRLGTPAQGYPWRWTVVPWIEGNPADLDEPSASQAPVLGAFLRSLHFPAPVEAPLNPMRGVPLRQRSQAMEERLQRVASKTSLPTRRVRHIWEVGSSAPLDVTPTWLHADLHPRNVLVEHGRISGIIDWGDLTSGDRATDLAAVWMLFARPEDRREALRAYGEVAEATLLRAQAWAALFGVMLLDTGLIDNPRNARLGERILLGLSGGEHRCL